MNQVSITEGGRGCRTRRPAPIVVLTFMLSFLVPASGDSQTQFTKYAGNPVLKAGSGWESAWVNFVSVIDQDSQYVMWYSGGGQSPGIGGAGRATSPDGLTWTKDQLNPVLRASSSAWDGAGAWIPKVLNIGNGYTMWFTGQDGSSSGDWQIGRATSPDGRTWVQDSTNPVLRLGAPGQWDAALVHTGSVIFDGTTYRMWYTGMDQGYVPFAHSGIGLAVSTDGIHWVKDTLNNPVLAAGPSGSFDANGVGECSVVFDGKTYHMFYDGNEINWFSRTTGIGYAFSTDGIHWTKYAHNPVVANGPDGSWDYSASSPFVLLKDSTFHMWYGGNNGVGYASALVTAVEAKGGAPTVQSFRLEQNYPNPFNPSTTISFTIPKAGFVTLKVYDLLGNEVRTLLSGELPAGSHQATFNGAGFASGVYFYRLRAGSLTQTKRLILAR